MRQPLTFTFALLLFSLSTFGQGQEQWSRFHGPNGQGISSATGLPTQWSATENIAWKTPIPGGNSWSSPIVWNDHIFLTTTTDGGKECRLLAIDRKTGDILWNKLVFTQEIRNKHERNSHATPTPVTDGQRVYAVFANGHLAAADFSGNIVWTNTELDFYSQHGFGASPMVYGDLLIVPVNPSINPNKNPNNEPVRNGWQIPWDRSYLWALDKNTGKEKWKGMRGMSRISHSTPVVIQVNGKDQILSAAGDVVQGFDPADGKRIWSVTNSGEPAVPTPAIGEGMVFMATSPTSPILGVKTDGAGDCTESHIIWKQPRNSPTTSSFLYVKPCLYVAADNGTFVALDAATGEVLWQIRIRGGKPDSSPIYADGKIYITTDSGTTMVLKLKEDSKQPAEVIAVNDIGEDQRVQATLAVAGKQLLIRTEKELWCIGK